MLVRTLMFAISFADNPHMPSYFLLCKFSVCCKFFFILYQPSSTTHILNQGVNHHFLWWQNNISHTRPPSWNPVTCPIPVWLYILSHQGENEAHCIDTWYSAFLTSYNISLGRCLFNGAFPIISEVREEHFLSENIQFSKHPSVTKSSDIFPLFFSLPSHSETLVTSMGSICIRTG